MSEKRKSSVYLLNSIDFADEYENLTNNYHEERNFLESELVARNFPVYGEGQYNPGAWKWSEEELVSFYEGSIGVENKARTIFCPNINADLLFYEGPTSPGFIYIEEVKRRGVESLTDVDFNLSLQNEPTTGVSFLGQYSSFPQGKFRFKAITRDDYAQLYNAMAKIFLNTPKKLDTRV